VAWQRSTGQDRAVPARFGGQLACETRLAHARLAEDHDDPACSAKRRLQPISKRSGVLFSPDKHWTQHRAHGLAYRSEACPSIGLLRDAGWGNIAAAVRYNAWRPGAALQLLGLTPD